MEQRTIELIESAIKSLGVTEDDPCIRDEDHPWNGLRLDSIMQACANSSWDFPTFIMILVPHDDEVDSADQLDTDDVTYYPENYPELIAIFQKFCPDLKPNDFIFDT